MGQAAQGGPPRTHVLLSQGHRSYRHSGEHTNSKKTKLTHRAVREWDHCKKLSELLQRGHAVDEKANDEMTLVMFAAQLGNVSAVRMLLEKKAVVNGQTVHGATPLMFVARNAKSSVKQLSELVASLLQAR